MFDDFQSPNMILNVIPEINENLVTRWKLLRNPRYTLAALSASLTYFAMGFMEPILALRLTDFNLKPVEIGLFFSIWAMTYIPMGFAILYLPRKFSKRITMIICASMTGVSFILAGPS